MKIFKYFFKINGIEYEIPHAPKGWEETKVDWKRDTNLYWANIQEFSLPFEFVLSAAQYLRKVLYTSGIDATPTLVVRKLNPKFESYEDFYEGDLDLSEAIDSRDTFEANLMISDLSAKIKSLNSTDFDYDFNDAIDVRVAGIDLIEYMNNLASGSHTKLTDYKLGTLIESYDTVLGSFIGFEQTEEERPNFGNWADPDNILIEAQRTTEVSITGTFKVKIKNSLNFGVFSYWNLYIASAGSRQLIHSTQDIPGNSSNYNRDNPPKEVTINISSNFNIVAGEKYYIMLSFESPFQGSTGHSMFEIVEGIFRVTVATTTEPVVIKALRPKTLFDKIINRISPNSTTQSNVLSSSLEVITSGDAIRGIQFPNLKTSFRDFYQSMNALYNVGLDMSSGNAILEKKDYFFRPIEIANLGDVKDFKNSPFKDALGSSYKIGYPDSSYDVENGRLEFNSTQEFTSPAVRVNKNIDLQSIYRADQFGIEELRIKQLSESTDNATETDNKWDKTIFMLSITEQPDEFGIYDLEYATAYDEVTGVVSRSSTYNLRITPKKNMLKHMAFLASSFYGINANGSIDFASSTKNADVVTVKDFVRVAENESIYIRDYLANRMFLPFEVSFKSNYPKNLQQLIKNTPYGYFSFTYKGDKFKGYLLECSVDIAKNTEQDFKLLLTPENDLTLLF
jgi:hypothetical protein